jgi:hypothetical protein
MSVQRSATIRGSIVCVFAFVSQIERLAAWDDTIVSTRRLSDAPTEVGTRFEQHIATDRGYAQADAVVIAYEPPHRFDWLRDLHGEREITRITLERTGEATLVRIRRQPADPAFDIALETRRLDSSLRRLGELLER